jgi:glycosyltransferase involved in cell wall biosynthesis
MSENVQFSVVIPTYNRGRIVGRAIESALAQKRAPSEIVVVDDGSTDGTRQIVESYGKNVRYMYQANAGVSTARNRGVKEAKEPWIAFLDSDDYWVPDHLFRIGNAIEGTRGEAALYFADLRPPIGKGESSFWRACGLEISGEWQFRRDAGDWALMPVQPMMLQASVLSRAVYLEIGGLTEQLRTREDTLLFFKLGLLYPACAVSGCGTIMNSDDDIRLSQVYEEESSVYLAASVLLYRELLASVNNISRGRRRILVDSLSAAYVGVGRILFHEKRYLSAMRNLGRSCVLSPSTFGKMISHSFARQLKAKKGIPARGMGLDPKP